MFRTRVKVTLRPRVRELFDDLKEDISLTVSVGVTLTLVLNLPVPLSVSFAE